MDEVRVTVKRALQIARLEEENRSLRQRSKTEGLDGILGNSPPIQEIFQSIRKIATVDVPILILGESGTGKELAAKAIHRLSHRKDGPFIVINCGAIPENLLESELFGHEKGAFTGADTRRKGRIEYAEGGTLFLDEIGELSLALQVKLLRFLQEHVIERVGGREVIPVNVRVLAATNRSLTQEIASGTFREDLFYRLGVVTLLMPPLRDRGDDLYLLARVFLHQYTSEFKKNLRGFTVDAIQAISEHPWPGNVREMENRIKRAVVMAEGEWVSSQDLNFTVTPQNTKPPNRLREARDTIEKQLIHQALVKHRWVVIKAAEELGISRQSLNDLIKKHGITPQ
jgi:two-component system NtrC family response regulator